MRIIVNVKLDCTRIVPNNVLFVKKKKLTTLVIEEKCFTALHTFVVLKIEGAGKSQAEILHFPFSLSFSSGGSFSSFLCLLET